MRGGGEEGRGGEGRGGEGMRGGGEEGTHTFLCLKKFVLYFFFFKLFFERWQFFCPPPKDKITPSIHKA